MHFLLHLFLPLSLLSCMPFSLLFLFRLPPSRMQYGRQFTLRSSKYQKCVRPRRQRHHALRDLGDAVG